MSHKGYSIAHGCILFFSVLYYILSLTYIGRPIQLFILELPKSKGIWGVLILILYQSGQHFSARMIGSSAAKPYIAWKRSRSSKSQLITLCGAGG